MYDLNRSQLEREGRKELASSGRAQPVAVICTVCPVYVKGPLRMNMPRRCTLRAHSGCFTDMLRL